jgi:hypothetical protein
MHTINGIPLVWNPEEDAKMFAPLGYAPAQQQPQPASTALKSPFGSESLFVQQPQPPVQYYKVQKRKP